MEKLIKFVKELWLTDITEDEAKNILKEHPNFYGSYLIQDKLFGKNK